MHIRDRLLDHFGVVLVLILASLAATAILPPDEPYSRLITLAIEVATLWTGLIASDVPSRVIRACLVAALTLSVVALTLSRLAPLQVWGTIGGLVSVALVAGTGAAIGRRVIHQDRVNVRTILAALCIYMLVGILFAVLMQVLARVQGSPALAGALNHSPVDYVYWSLITLTTTGYGDITPVTNVARMVAASEAFFGQVYLVTVVALLVSNIGRRRGTPSGS